MCLLFVCFQLSVHIIVRCERFILGGTTVKWQRRSVRRMKKQYEKKKDEYEETHKKESKRREVDEECYKIRIPTHTHIPLEVYTVVGRTLSVGSDAL